MENFSVRCSECRGELKYQTPRVYPGTSDKVIVPEVCPKCFSLTEDVSEEIKQAREEQEADTTKEVLRELLNQASVMSMNDVDTEPDQDLVEVLRQIINSHEDLEPFLYMMERGKK